MRRAYNVLLMPRGRFSSMLDMGGQQQASADTSLNVGKNLTLRAIALDFDLITRSIESSKAATHTKDEGKDIGFNAKSKPAAIGRVEPNQSMVTSIASLLNVSLGDDSDDKNDGLSSRRRQKDDIKDDLSLLTGDSDDSTKQEKTEKSRDIRETISNDIRAKYADKLRSKVEGGLAGIESANHQRDEAMKKGDAATHLNARSIAASTTVSRSGSKWLATTGTGSLLSYLNSRSMKIALMPLPIQSSQQDKEEVGNSMNDLSNQLPNIKFDLLMNGLDNDEDEVTARAILDSIIHRIETPPKHCIVVSDRDDILRSARDKSMYTCRVRKKNAPRGNVTTDYTVEDVSGVEEVINEVNGISYNTVFSRGS